MTRLCPAQSTHLAKPARRVLPTRPASATPLAPGGDDSRHGGAPPPVLEVRGLRVERERVILRGINWVVRPGENWVVLGANGSGKTTLLSVLTGYAAESAGSVSVAGATRGRDDWRELRKRVGLVSSALQHLVEPEEPALHVVCGGRDAQVNLWVRPAPALARAALSAMRKTGCARTAAQPWRTLSQGERQRVLIARALCSGLALLILDEPCAGLDPAAREHFLKMLARLGRGRGAVPLVLVTHHVEEIIPLFTHALLLRRGGVLASGPIGATLTDAHLSRLFDVPARLRRNAEHRYSLELGALGSLSGKR